MSIENRRPQLPHIPTEERVVPNSALERAFLQMSADTLPREGAIRHKKALVAEIAKRKLLDREVLREFPTVYVGSGIDFEYPLCLGARNIILVDPILSDHTAIEKLKQRVKAVAGHDLVVVSETEIQFSLDGEAVSIQFAAALYGSAERILDIHEQTRRYSPKSPVVDRFTPPEQIGLILGFQTAGTDLDADAEAMSRVVDGGYVLTNNLMTSILDPAEPLYMLEPEDRVKKVGQQWSARGYAFIPLETEGDSYQYTFLKKNKS